MANGKTPLRYNGVECGMWFLPTRITNMRDGRKPYKSRGYLRWKAVSCPIITLFGTRVFELTAVKLS